MNLNEIQRVLKENDADFILISIMKSGPQKGWYFCNISSTKLKRWAACGTGPDPENAVAEAIRKWQEGEPEYTTSTAPELNLSLGDL
jgi:hypothetical protein